MAAIVGQFIGKHRNIDSFYLPEPELETFNEPIIDSMEKSIPWNRFRLPGWESIPGLLKRFTNSGSAQIHRIGFLFHKIMFFVSWLSLGSYSLARKKHRK
jgi:hypothetical protein